MAQDVDTLGGVIFGHGHIVNKDGRGLLVYATYQISRLWSKCFQTRSFVFLTRPCYFR